MLYPAHWAGALKLDRQGGVGEDVRVLELLYELSETVVNTQWSFHTRFIVVKDSRDTNKVNRHSQFRISLNV